MAQFPSKTGPNSGVWTIEDVYNARISDNWPDALFNRGIFSAGLTPVKTNIMDYVTISTTGNATDFGDLDADLFSCGSVSNSTRGVVGGGGDNANTGVNTMQYVAIATTGNATDFGDLNAGTRVNGPAGVSNSTRGIFAGAEGAVPAYTLSNVIDYITIDTTGNATDFGDLLSARYVMGGTCSTTRGVFAGGNNPATNVIQYITIASTGNATDFGDLNDPRSRIGSGVQSNGTRGLFSGGEVSGAGVNTIEYITIASTGNALDFGDLTAATASSVGATSSKTRALAAGHNSGPKNIIDYVEIATTGNATDFGDLTVGRLYVTGMSNVHGGL